MIDMKRKNFIDNLRLLCILLLFPYHIGMIYNGFFSDYYVYYKYVSNIDYFLMFINLWFMPLMFALAGMSAYYALKKRSIKEFIKERVIKLFIPCIFATLLVLPSISYIGHIFHNGSSNDFLNEYLIYFTKFSDIYGFSGGFTPAHIWFLEDLFGITLFSFSLMIILMKYKEILKIYKMPLFIIYLLFIIPLSLTPLFIIGIYSLGQNFAIFILGYIVLSDENILRKLNQNKYLCTIITILSIITTLYIYHKTGYKNYLKQKTATIYMLENFTTWSCILSLIALSQSFLNKSNKITKYLSNISFQIYIFHHSLILIIAFYIIKLTSNVSMQFAMVMILSFISTLIICEIINRSRILCFMFGGKYSG